MTSRSSASAPSGFSKLPLIDTNKRCTGSGFSPTASMSRPLGAISRVLHAARKWLYEHDVAAEWELLTNELESGNCRFFTKGDRVFVEDCAVLSGEVAIHGKGDPDTFWIPNAAVDTDPR
jgi:hypothetical protein